MIRIQRANEGDACPELAVVRNAELARVREALRAGKEASQALLGTEYKVARRALARGQHLKCCYCEDRLQDDRWEHVEHFRPKAATTTSPSTYVGAGISSSPFSTFDPAHSGSGSEPSQLYATRCSVWPPTVTGPWPMRTPPQAS